ncbi:hypothetical protein B0H14DRAFT_3537966 [Mycena olivaceomarginata]|nr:hypothetical protein B0H14DRAFT_3537966 [Mycena olivaceomarginata]
MEHLHFERGRAAFTLKDRLQKHRLAHPSSPADNSGLEEEDNGEEWYELEGEEVRIHHEQTWGSIGVNDSAPCEASKENDKRKFKALWGRYRTHNEQLLVRTCDVIVQRETFYTAEAVSNVLEEEQMYMQFMAELDAAGGQHPRRCKFEIDDSELYRE